MEKTVRKMESVSSICEGLRREVAKAIIGKNDVLRMVEVGILSNGNILFEDFPGLAKTLIANTFSKVLGCKFRRIQFTPDLLPSDITGIYIYNEKEGDFKFRPGPIFTNILLADEINRAPPKTQAALLEAMQEKQVTIEGITHTLPEPFIVLATQNPIEYEGTYPLPEAQLDRFMMKMNVGYPNRDEEDEILRRRAERKKDEVNIETLTDPKKVLGMQKAVENVHVDPAVRRYMVEIVTRTREEPGVMVGASPRGSQALFKLSRAFAAVNGRDFVLPDDVKNVAVPGLKHRLILRPEARIRGVKTENIINKILSEIPVPII
ncbi:MAG: MoxR family ATPase [Thermoplasmatales archaeon]|nr:MoxR family ATPase [Thermoplasmatales archaeon]